MTTTYAAKLRASGQDGGPAGIDVIADVVGRWARIGNPLQPRHEAGHKGGGVTTEILGTADSPPWGWRLRMSHPDSEDSRVVWTVAVTAITGETSDIDIRLGRTFLGGALMPVKHQRAAPACVRRLLDSESLRFEDAGRPITNEVWVVRAEDAEELARFARSPDRRLPIFAMTGRDDDPIDAGRLLPCVVGLAHVALVKPEASWLLNELLPLGFNVYGGAARIWWPGFETLSSRWDHDLWTGDHPAEVLEGEAATLIVNAGLAAATVDPRLRKIDQKRRDADLRLRIREIEKLRQSYEEAVGRSSATHDHQEDSEERSELAELEELASEYLQRAAAAEHELEVALQLAAETEKEASQAKERAYRAERDHKFLQEEIERLQLIADAKGPRTSQSIDHSILLSEIELFLETLGDVDGARARPFQLGKYFESRVANFGASYRKKIIKACADVVLGSLPVLAKRENHPLRVGSGPNDATVVRSFDGAEAHRCYVEQGVASARRLHYWRLPDGSIEFASVNIHDDMEIPEGEDPARSTRTR